MMRWFGVVVSATVLLAVLAVTTVLSSLHVEARAGSVGLPSPRLRSASPRHNKIVDLLARNQVVLHGGLSARERKAALATLAATPDDQERLVLALNGLVADFVLLKRLKPLGHALACRGDALG